MDNDDTLKGLFEDDDEEEQPQQTEVQQPVGEENPEMENENDNELRGSDEENM